MSEKVYQDSTLALYQGDCLDVMRAIPDNFVDSIVTDPPYGLGFMGKAWDALPPGEDWARECIRVLKPGGHLLAFGGTRTWHRLAVAVEDAGFEIRDSLAWLYGSGFPKSMDVSKAIDKAAGAQREVVATRKGAGIGGAGTFAQDEWTESMRGPQDLQITAPSTDAAQQWAGWGTALKPAFEPVVMGRKPLIGTVSANVLEHSTGALNIDGCRIATDENLNGGSYSETYNAKVPDGDERTGAALGMYQPGAKPKGPFVQPSGRWPANVAFDESQADVLDQQANASRFFYVAKAPKKERPVVDGVAHPTVKPVAIMQWLVKLVTPAGGIVLDPFEGSGTTAQACALEGFKHIGIEREADYLPLIAARLNITLDQLQPA